MLFVLLVATVLVVLISLVLDALPLRSAPTIVPEMEIVQVVLTERCAHVTWDGQEAIVAQACVPITAMVMARAIWIWEQAMVPVLARLDGWDRRVKYQIALTIALEVRAVTEPANVLQALRPPIVLILPKPLLVIVSWSIPTVPVPTTTIVTYSLASQS